MKIKSRSGTEDRRGMIPRPLKSFFFGLVHCLGVSYRLRNEVHSLGKQVFQFINGGLPLTAIRAQ